MRYPISAGNGANTLYHRGIGAKIGCIVYCVCYIADIKGKKLFLKIIFI